MKHLLPQWPKLASAVGVKKAKSMCNCVVNLLGFFIFGYLTAVSGDGKLVLMLLNIGFAVSLHFPGHRKKYNVPFMSPNPSWSPILKFLG